MIVLLFLSTFIASAIPKSLETNSNIEFEEQLIESKVASSSSYSIMSYPEINNNSSQDTNKQQSKFEPKVESFPYYSSEIDAKTNHNINSLSFPNAHINGFKKQNSDPAHSIKSLKFQDDDALLSPSFAAFANSTFCTACSLSTTNHGVTRFLEYNGVTYVQPYEITPYVSLSPWENLADYNFSFIRTYYYIFRGQAIVNSTDSVSWGMGQTFNDPLYYGANVGTYWNSFSFKVTRGGASVISAPISVLAFVRDTKKPILLHSPENQTLTSIGGISDLNWRVSDLLPDYYTIKKGDVQVQNGTFHSNETVNYQNVTDDLIPGLNEFTITFFDTSRNSVSHTFSVLVTDVIPPLFEHPSNLVYPFGATGNQLIWKPVDLNTLGNYMLLSPSGNVSGTWNNNDELVFNVDGLPVGVHNYTIIIGDFFGNFGQDTVLVTVYDPSPPEINFLNSVTIEHGALNHNLSWTPTDSNPSHYTLKQDGIILEQNQQWISGKAIEVSLNELPVGITRYEIIFYDSAGWSVSDSVTVNVVDTTSPKITPEFPQTIERDTILNNPEFYYLNWVLTDLNPTIYTITVNNAEVRLSSWKNGDEILYFLSETEFGTYNYTISAQDLYGNMAKQSVRIIVQDTLSPTIINLADKIYDYGHNHSFSWFATDGRPAYFNITVNNTLLHEGTWASGQAIEFAANQLELGLYHFILKLWDMSGNLASDSFSLTIRDSDIPKIVSPGSQMLKLWEIKSLEWIVTDLSRSGSYELSQNGKKFECGMWENGIPIELQIQTNVTGTYSYELLVKDTAGKVAIDQITITIFVLSSNSQLPEIPDKTLEFGTTGETLTWFPENFNNGNYTLAQNGQLITTNSYWLSKNPITTLLDNLSIGDHVYNLTILDFSNTIATDIVTITIKDTIEPEIITSTEVEFSIINTERLLHWKAVDWHPKNYQLILDTQLIANGSWISNQNETVKLSNHSVGTYNYTLIVFDQFNNSQSQIIKVTVHDKLKPVITPVANRSYELGDETFPITWMITDDTLDYFKVYKNDNLILTNFWETGQILSINLTNLPVGMHNYTLLASDHSQNTASASVFIKIEDTTFPVLEASSDLHLQVAQTGQSITWRAFDLQADSYFLWHNGSLLETNMWFSGEILNFSLTVTASGIYNYTLQATDGSSNVASSSIFVFVTDQLPPRISVIQSELTIEYGSTGNELIWDVFEAEKWNYTLTHNNAIVIESREESNQIITQNIDGLELGKYFNTLSIVDSAQNTASKTVVVNVVDTTKPVLIEEPNTQIFSYVQLYTLTWSASDISPDRYQILRDGNSVKSGTWEGQDRINYTLTQLVPGKYNFTTIFFDSSGNLAYSIKILTIEDKILPVANFSGNVSYELATNGYTLSWDVLDDFPEELIIVQDLYLSSLEISTLNLSEIELRFQTPINSEIESLHDLYQYLLTTEEAILLHKYNYQNFVSTPEIAFTSAKTISYTVLIYDQSGNLNYNSVNISIIDTSIPEFALTPHLTITETEFTWSATDLAPADYEILINESLYETGTWDSTSKINTSLNALEPGFYQISIKIYDESLNHNSYEFYLNKKELATPDPGIPRDIIVETFSVEVKIYHEMGDATNSEITWNRPGESTSLHYELYENGKLTRSSMVWPDELQLNRDLNSLPTGIHNFTLKVKGIDGNFYRNITIIEVRDTITPNITANGETDTISSTSGNIVTLVNLFDINPDLYYVYLNNSIINSGSWKNREVVVINIVGLQPGNYELQITAYDSYANNATKKLTITVYSSQSNTQNNLSSSEIIFQFAWWTILVAMALTVGLVAARKTIIRMIKK